MVKSIFPSPMGHHHLKPTSICLLRILKQNRQEIRFQKFINGIVNVGNHFGSLFNAEFIGVGKLLYSLLSCCFFFI